MEKRVFIRDHFIYDNLDRLTYFGAMKKTPIGGIIDNIYHDTQGNITSTPYTGNYTCEIQLFNYSIIQLLTAYTGDYTYEINTSKPHAVEQVTLTSANSSKISASDCAVEYTMFNKAKTITEDNWHLELFYGADQQREKTVLKEDNNVVKTKYFCGDLYERVITSEDTLTINNEQLIINNFETVYLYRCTESLPLWGGLEGYHTDHLGSYNYITDAGKNRIDSLHFDPWGNRMKYHKWAQPDIGRTFFSDRGFTGHEHLDQFKIINMNGRLYDPVIARFFSPDPFVQMPNFTQSYNRYSYCLNNPLMYTDPSGEFVITFLVNAIIGWSKGENGWKAGGNAVWNSLKMVGGLFTSDKNKNGWTQTWEVISRLTWQLPQTILGFGFGQFQNTFGGVRSVNLYRGATVINSRWMSDGEAVTLGSYITGGNNIKADVNNSLFQHEYGHYIQSQYMGPAYLAKVGIPSLFGAGGNNIHDFQIYEQDANRRAFEYFNRREPGFYQTEEEYLYNESNGIRKGWDFYANPLDPTHETFRGTYYDYKNADHMLWLNNSLSLKARWYDIMMGFIDPLGLIMGSFNHIYNNQHRP